MYDITGGYMTIIKFNDLKYLSEYYHQFRDFKNDIVVVDSIENKNMMFLIRYKGEDYELYDDEFEVLKDNKINRLLYGRD